MNVSKTYLGKTGGGYVRDAHVQQMESGDHYVYAGGYQLIIRNDGNMCVVEYDHAVAVLSLSNTAYRRLEALEGKADAMTMAWLEKEES